MTSPGRFHVHGVIWRQLVRWSVLNLPIWFEPLAIAWWSLVFLLWGPGRRAVMRNLSAILPGSWRVTNFVRTYRVFWNYAWSITETSRFRELRKGPDWQFAGIQHFDELRLREGGAIILTAHMGSYDLAAQLFAETSGRRIVMVRAPEIDPQTRQYEEQLESRTGSEGLKIDFSTRSVDLALDLLDALQRGEVVAIQGDRAAEGIATLPGTLFGQRTRVPAGPFALAMTSQVPIYPLFVMRLGRRSYRLVTGAPFFVTRTRDRAEAFELGVAQWTAHLEQVVRDGWFQWFAFQPFSEETAA